MYYLSPDIYTDRVRKKVNKFQNMPETLQRKETDSPNSEPMRLADLTEAVLKDIVTIYDEVASSELAREFVRDANGVSKLQYIEETLGFTNAVEWRFGSRIARDTKLFIWRAGWKDGSRLIKFSFDPNSAVSDPDGTKKAELDFLTLTFKERVNSYLAELQASGAHI